MIGGWQAKLAGFGLLVLGILFGALKLIALGKSSAVNEMAAKTGEKRAKLKEETNKVVLEGVQKEHEIKNEKRDPNRKRDILS